MLIFLFIQISGNIGVAKDALAEIASRLRVRTLRDANAGAEHTPVGLAQGFGPPRSIRDGPPLPSSLRAGNFGVYDPLKVPSFCLKFRVFISYLVTHVCFYLFII